MTIKEFSWKTAQGLSIYAAEWPVENAKAVVGLVHGVGEHCRRYDHVGAFLRGKGIAMVGFDRQGNGRSEGKRGHADQFSYFLDEVSTLVIECERRYPDRPVFLLGHSLGGMVVLHYIIKRNPNIAGAIISAPYIDLAFRPKAFLVGLGKVMNNIWPTFTQNNDLDLSQLSRDPAVQNAYVNDPLVTNKITARGGMDALAAGDFLNNWQGTLSVPLLFSHGDADGMTSFPATKAFAERIDGQDITFKPWPDHYHELHNEPEKEVILDYYYNWLVPRIESSNSERKLKSV